MAQMNGQEGVSCSSGECTYDFGEDKTDSAFTFVTATSPTVMRANVDFALNSTSNGDYTSEDGETDGSGEAEAIFDADSTGGVKSYVSSGNSDDVQTVALVDTSKVISAFEPNTNDDTKYEFVRLYFATAVDTTGWTLSDDEGSSQVTDLPAETLDGEVYFARDGAAFAEKWGLDKSRVYNMSTQLNNNGEPLWLNDSRGTVVDQVGYGGESPAGFDGSVSQPSQGQVANRTFVGGSYPYQDTNSDSDWALEGESDFFDTVASGGFNSQSVSDLVPSTSGQRQTFTFEPDQTIEGGTQVTINLTEAQQASPRQVDYRGSVASVSDGTATLNKKSADVAFLNWTAPSSDVAGGTTVRIVVEGVKTGPESNQNDPYSVDVTREDSGETTTGVFEVGRNTGGAELRNVAVTDLQENNSSQSQELVFEPTTDLDAGQSISIDLSQAAGANDVDYTGASATVNASTSDLSFTDQTTDNASIRYTAPSGGLSADTPVKITVSGVSVGDGRRGEQRRHRRGPDVTMNARGRGQSTTVGNILLVGIIVVMTTTVSLGIVSNLTGGDGTFDDAAPQFDVRAEATGENITLGHNGGDSVAADRVLVVVANDTTERRFRVDPANLTGGDNRYDPGDTFRRAHGLEGEYVDVLVVVDGDRAGRTILDTTLAVE